jgi:hypothetical protein
MWWLKTGERPKIWCDAQPIRRTLGHLNPAPDARYLMSPAELLTLLTKARAVLDRYLFDDEEMLRDDVAAVCTAIDDALPDETRVLVKKVELETAVRRSAA